MGLQSLEDRTQEWLDRLGIAEEPQKKFWEYAATLKAKAPNMYAHSLRVGNYARAMGEREDMPNKSLRLLFMGGGLHDVGKSWFDADLFCRDITKEEYSVLQRHAIEGFLMMKDSLPMTAIVAGSHHMPHYGLQEDQWPLDVDPQTKAMVKTCIGLVSMADFYDAMVSRDGKAQSVMIPIKKDDPVQIASIMSHKYELDPKLVADRLQWLYCNTDIYTRV